MRSDFKNFENLVEDNKCQICYGSGKENDADCGDIYYNEWTCRQCSGTGWKDGISVLERLKDENRNSEERE